MPKIIEILRLKYDSKLSHQKIAQAVGLSKGAIVLFLALLSLSLGQRRISPLEALLSPFTDTGSITAVILREIQLPRTLIAIVAGISLGVSGAAMPGLL